MELGVHIEEYSDVVVLVKNVIDISDMDIIVVVVWEVESISIAMAASPWRLMKDILAGCNVYLERDKEQLNIGESRCRGKGLIIRESVLGS